MAHRASSAFATWESIVKILEAVLYAVLLTAALAFILGWWFMVTVGVAHGEWSDSIPTIGYWGAVKLTAIATLGISTGRARARFNKLREDGQSLALPVK